ncbi:MAG: hypothetical protein P8183_13405 [Anaerolineae bacterium]|jgi:hypothetical protein
MSKTDDESANYRARLAEEKLQVLRNEIFGCLVHIDANAKLLLLELSKNEYSELPSELSDWIQNIIDKSEEISQFVITHTE